MAGCHINANIRNTNKVLLSMNTIAYVSAHTDCVLIPRYSEPI